MTPPVCSTHARLRSLLPQHQQVLFDRVSQLVKRDPSVLDNRSPQQGEKKNEGTPPNV